MQINYYHYYYFSPTFQYFSPLFCFVLLFVFEASGLFIEKIILLLFYIYHIEKLKIFDHQFSDAGPVEKGALLAHIPQRCVGCIQTYYDIT